MITNNNLTQPHLMGLEILVMRITNREIPINKNKNRRKLSMKLDTKMKKWRMRLVKKKKIKKWVKGLMLLINLLKR